MGGSAARWRSSTLSSTTGAIRVKVRADHRVTSRSAHIAVGVDMEGGLARALGIWVQVEEGSSFWAHVCAELANRGVADVLIVCCDGLVGLPEAVEATWERAWDRFTPFLAFGPMLRRVIYTTNSIESLNYQLRKVSKNRGSFPSDAAVVKLLWLAICDIEDKRARERDKEAGLRADKRRAKGRLVQGQVTTDWKQALSQLTAAYPERVAPYL